MQNKNIKMILFALIAIGAFVALAFFYMYEKKETLMQNSTPDKNGASLISQENNIFKINLKFSNDKKEKSIVRYAVLLYKADEKGEIVGESPMDVKQYPDKVVLGEGKSKNITKEISYVAPSYLDGKYVLVVDEFAESGIQINSAVVGNVNVQGKNNDFLEIMPETCLLQIEGEKNNIVYTNDQGVDIKREENFLITCSVKNHSKKEIIAQPTFENYYRDYGLGELKDQESVTIGVVNFAPNQTKNISLPITKALNAQVYDAALFLTRENGTTVSNKVYTHYIIVGESANINNVTLDKTHYAPGENAKLNFEFNASVDNFDYSRHGGTKNPTLKAEIDIRGNDDISCLSEKKIIALNPVNSINEDLMISISHECKNPFVVATLYGNYDGILDTRTFLRE